MYSLFRPPDTANIEYKLMLHHPGGVRVWNFLIFHWKYDFFSFQPNRLKDDPVIYINFPQMKFCMALSQFQKAF